MTHQSPHDKAADAVHEGRPVEAQYVRGGRGGVRILTLLLVSLAAVAVLLLGMWFVSQGGFAKTNANDGDQAVDAAAFQTDPAATSGTPTIAAEPAAPAAP
jgi:flagellar basal body-associated protein FliL